MHTVGCQTTFGGGHDGLAELVTIGSDITSSIETFDACLLTLVDDETTFGIFIGIQSINHGRDRCRTDGDEYAIEREDIISF